MYKNGPNWVALWTTIPDVECCIKSAWDNFYVHKASCYVICFIFISFFSFQEMRLLCLDRHVLRLSMLYRADVLGLANINMEDVRLKHQSLRYSGYRQYTLWQHGRLGRGNRRVFGESGMSTLTPGQCVPYRPGGNWFLKTILKVMQVMSVTVIIKLKM